MASCGTVEVLPQFNPDDVSIESCSVDGDSLAVGESVTATATVANAQSNAEADVTVRFTSGGETVRQSTTVPAGSSRTVRASFTYSNAGTYTLEVGVGSASRA